MPRIIKVTGETPSIPEGGMYDTKFEPHIKIFEIFKFFKFFKLSNSFKNDIFGKVIF